MPITPDEIRAMHGQSIEVRFPVAIVDDDGDVTSVGYRTVAARLNTDPTQPAPTPAAYWPEPGEVPLIDQPAGREQPND